VSRVAVGLDVGSTTVKAVVVDAASGELLWAHYQRHETRQAELALELLDRIEEAFPAALEERSLAITGSGGAVLAPHLGARFVQEVTAVALAVEERHPGAGSVVELGGQDAKIIIFRRDDRTGRATKVASMNDKCAGGTGAVLDKIATKLRIAPDDLTAMSYRGVKVHPVAGKCGVFAETDVNSLQKLGVPASELMASVFEAIVGQNLSVLTRGNTLRPEVLLLGGPHVYLPGLVDAWRHNIGRLWDERGVIVDDDLDAVIRVPEHALYFAALGAVELGRREPAGAVRYRGTGPLREYVEVGRLAGLPPEVVERAREILAELEGAHGGGGAGLGHHGAGAPEKARDQLSLFAPPEHPVVDRLRRLQVEELTPMQALNLLAELQTMLRDQAPGR